MMNRDELRLQFKRDTGDDPFKEGNYMTQPLRHPYFSWMEEKLLEMINEKDDAE